MRAILVFVLGVVLCCTRLFAATDLSDPRFESSDPAKAPQSVPLSEIESRINNDPASEGILLSIKCSKRVLSLDLMAMPGKTSLAVATRVVFMTARLAKSDYDEMRFTDEGTDLFVIDGATIRDIGRQFVWGEVDKGQNPIHLMRLFVNALKYPDGRRVAPEFPGSLFGDTAIATRTITEIFNPGWVVNKNTKVL